MSHLYHRKRVIKSRLVSKFNVLYPSELLNIFITCYILVYLFNAKSVDMV